MQLTPNSLKFLVASIILNEVEKKDITVEDLFLPSKLKELQQSQVLPKANLAPTTSQPPKISISSQGVLWWTKIGIHQGPFLLSVENGSHKALTAPFSL